MKWAIGVLTWNDPERCLQTLAALRSRLEGEASLTVFDNGSEEPFAAAGVNVVRSDVNLGAGAGLGALMRVLLSGGTDRVLFLEDDWTLTAPLALAGLEPILADPEIGQVRLGLRAERPSERYWTYGLEGADAARSLAQADNPRHAYPGGHYQKARLLWSSNPFACRWDVAHRFLIEGLDELRLGRAFYDSGLLVASTTPGHFEHGGEIRARRGRAGWKK